MVAMPSFHKDHGGRSGSERFRERVDFQSQIKGFPPGWQVIEYHECQCGHDRDAVVLCRRLTDDGDHGTDYVVWWVNMDLGGCYNGHYTDDRSDADRIYAHRRKQLQ